MLLCISTDETFWRLAVSDQSAKESRRKTDKKNTRVGEDRLAWAKPLKTFRQSAAKQKSAAEAVAQKRLER